MQTSKHTHLFAIIFLGFFNLLILAYGAEFFLAILEIRAKPPKKQRLSFDTQFLHPYYFFSFPSSKERLAEINQASEWIDSRGYKGEGPEARGKRKLAFLTGGSTAFSVGTMNSQSIASYLNRMQTEFFFVTAGVPSWNSFQELLRIMKQILKENPQLIVSLNGANDYFVGMVNGQGDFAYPLDAPESFGDLEAKVEDIRAERTGPGSLLDFFRLDPFYRHFLLVNLRGYLFGEVPPSARKGGFDVRPPLPESTIAVETAKLYLENVSLIHELCKNRGVAHMAFFQPVQFYDPEFRKTEKSFDYEELWPSFELYRDSIFARKISYLKDLSQSKELFGKGESRLYFLDTLHFRPKGNEIVAKLILQQLKSASAK